MGQPVGGLNQPLNDNHDNQNRQNELQQRLQRARQANALARVRFFQIFVKAPAPLRYAEEQINQAANREQQVGNNEILPVQHGTACAKRLETAPQVEPQHARHAGQQDKYRADNARAAAVHAEQLHHAGNDVFKHGDDRREARKRHEQEEQRSPHAAARHAGEDIGQGDENQARPGIRRDAVGKTGGENNQPRADGHKRIQRADAHGFAGQRVSRLI